MRNHNLGEEYFKHKIFEHLDIYIDFYNLLSDSVARFINPGTNNIINFETFLISSIKNTLHSIKLILADGKINDAYALTRKYHDSVTINIYAILYLQNNWNFKNMVVEKINNWLRGKEKLPEYKKMNDYIESSDKLKAINIKLDDKIYKNLRKRCNDHTHYNYFEYMMLNVNEIFNSKRIKYLDELSIDIRDVFIKHTVLLFTLSESYMMSSDYVDYLDIGQTPPEDSQYWVASFVQNIFDNIIKVYRNDLAEEIIKTTSMKLE